MRNYKEILFRAKRKDNGEWVYGFLIRMWGVLHIIDKDNENIAYEIIHETVGQFIGLVDKNGEKIFENDIIIYTWNTLNRHSEKYKYVITYDKENAKFIANQIYGESQYPLSTFKYSKQRIEVIGNIYGNHELLGELLIRDKMEIKK